MRKHLYAAVLLAGTAPLGPVLACATHGTNAGNTLSDWVDETAENHVGRISRGPIP